MFSSSFRRITKREHADKQKGEINLFSPYSCVTESLAVYFDVQTPRKQNRYIIMLMRLAIGEGGGRVVVILKAVVYISIQMCRMGDQEKQVHLICINLCFPTIHPTQ